MFGGSRPRTLRTKRVTDRGGPKASGSMEYMLDGRNVLPLSNGARDGTCQRNDHGGSK
jgi:hypothetical protein